jgi:hypothetical protein
MHRVDGRLLAVAALYLLVGLGGAWLLADTTVVGADLGTYQRAASDLYEHGDPYRSAASVSEDFRYRYPPLLAMLKPLLDVPLLWYALLAVATAYPLWLAVRERGWLGILPGLLLVGPWAQQLLNGNAQGFVVAFLAMVPFHARAGAVALAVAAMLKLHPALGIAWYVARRDWRAVGWFSAATVALLVIQLPWLDRFLTYYLTDPTATSTVPGLSLRAFGPAVWILGILVVGVLAWRGADGRWGWLLNVVWQLVALPRVLLVNLALLLAAPLPGRGRPHAGEPGRR